MGKIINDLTGRRFGKLTVLCRGKDYIAPSTGKKYVRWLCKCDCGNEKDIAPNSLLRGLSKTCGLCIEENKVSHIYESENYLSISVDGQDCYIDIDDYDKIKKYHWYINPGGYVCSSKNGKTIFIHRIIMNFDGDFTKQQTDHINRNKLDNRKSNLRIVSVSENAHNRVTFKNNKSGYKDVSFDKGRKKWRSEISINGKTQLIGFYNLKEDAIDARMREEQKYKILF